MSGHSCSHCKTSKWKHPDWRVGRHQRENRLNHSHLTISSLRHLLFMSVVKQVGGSFYRKRPKSRFQLFKLVITITIKMYCVNRELYGNDNVMVMTFCCVFHWYEGPKYCMAQERWENDCRNTEVWALFMKTVLTINGIWAFGNDLELMYTS